MPCGYTLKTELIHHYIFLNREEAKQAVFEYNEIFYNRERMHSANGDIYLPLTTRRSNMLLNLVRKSVDTSHSGSDTNNTSTHMRMTARNIS
jgi:Integrase core domain